MRAEAKPISAGLHLVSTPIGAARDITLRALDVLGSADVLAAEDTRTLRHLMEIHGVALNGRRVLAYHDHSDARARERLLAPLREGRSVAYASEAGTPLIADPGYQLVRAAAAEGLPVTAAPGASAVLTALTLSGLPTDRFLFAGFPPPKAAERRSWLAEILAVPATLVLYESPKRIQGLLSNLVQTSPDRQAAVCRELTKRFEEVIRGTVAEIAEALAGRDLKGEIVLVLDRGPADGSGFDLDAALRSALKTMSIRDAADAVAGAAGLPRRQVYQAALALGKDS
ncbi:16S rRNA (cytidine(1402)-2'-O)-methyltransferase [Frigidibacter sp. ROC022]|uniref:16S rRNA (cytidine(1402)-2'-O)-methyltransferase n=1 Tax=Frigidibacter sp. ROC022 TaxID=2971796 RepID=UPI00215ACC0C|nr:16S rRNA (cytidine(1402)-2'-O)-methyltransferase [Frigidibacter sp. ROC022]MCR8724023.1 16S rRNA (cytidine(1402)-2'-O)-methyltransferase [Frigidibacter sp. ROC022]